MAKRWATRADLIDPNDGIAQEFCDLPAGVVQVYLDLAQEQLDLTRWGTQTSQAHAFLAAHLLTANDALGDGSGERGPVVSEAHGPASVSYATISASVSGTDAAAFEGTSYGRTYLMIRRSVRGVGGAVRVGQG